MYINCCSSFFKICQKFRSNKHVLQEMNRKWGITRKWGIFQNSKETIYQNMQLCGRNLNPSHQLKETNLKRHLVGDPIIQVYGYNKKMNTCQGLKERNEWVQGAQGIFMTVDLHLRAPACYVHTAQRFIFIGYSISRENLIKL